MNFRETSTNNCVKHVFWELYIRLWYALISSIHVSGLLNVNDFYEVLYFLNINITPYSIKSILLSRAELQLGKIFLVNNSTKLYPMFTVSFRQVLKSTNPLPSLPSMNSCRPKTRYLGKAWKENAFCLRRVWITYATSRCRCSMTIVRKSIKSFHIVGVIRIFTWREEKNREFL